MVGDDHDDYGLFVLSGNSGRPRAVLILALYAFAVFGNVTATLATYFVGRDAERDNQNSTNTRAILELKAEVRAMRAELSKVLRQNANADLP